MKIRGAYDKDGQWWFEEDIKSFTGGIIRMSFGKEREQIKIIERVKIPIPQKETD